MAAMPVCAVAQSGSAPKAVAPVSNTYPRLAAGSAVQNPLALFNSNGVLQVEFTHQTRTENYNRQLYCFMTPSALENPTLHVNPGEHLIVTVTNNKPAGMYPMALSGANCGATFMNGAS